MPSPSLVRVALYTRVSTDLQAMADEGSLQTQEARLRAAVTARGPGHEVVAVFKEEGASGKNLDRPALRKLLAAVEAGMVDLTMVTRLDRLSRSLLDFFELHKLFERKGVQFYSLNESFDTSTAVGRAMLKLVLVFAELEREQTAERTKVAMLARAERGIWNGGHPILGYESDGAGHLRVLESEAAIVRAAFEKMLEFRSSREVAKWLNSQGYRQKRYASRRRGDKGERTFSPPVVVHMLQDRRYLGEVRHAGQFFPGRHDAIVDSVTFERVQQTLDGNRQGQKALAPAAEHHFLLTGMLTCGSCGYALTTASAKGHKGVRYPYYRCVSTTKQVDVPCAVRILAADKLEGAVLAVVREVARRPEMLAEAAAEAERIIREELEPGRQRLDGLRAELAGVRQETERLFNAVIASGLGDLGHAKDRLRALDERRQQLEAAIAAEEGRLSVSEEHHLDVDLVAQALRDFDSAYEHLLSDNYTSPLTTTTPPHGDGLLRGVETAAGSRVAGQEVSTGADDGPAGEEADGGDEPTREGGSCGHGVRDGPEDGAEVHRGGEVAVGAGETADLEDASGPVRGGVAGAGGAVDGGADAGGEDPVRGAAGGAPGRVPPGAAPDAPAPDPGVAGAVGSGEGGVLPPAPPARRGASDGLHGWGGARGHGRWRSVRPPAVSCGAAVLEL
ncbi:recombinase family protein, partial [Myxococcota bacterium]|nr:recombinase family protein [Myxococcota bacterium]